MRKTHALVQLAVALLADPFGQHWGYELARQSGVRSGVMYPALHRLLESGWLSDGWEDPKTIDGGRPPRRYYKLTDKGRRELSILLDEARFDPRFAGVLGMIGG
jgi:PadR family transcriptional regulator PadR